MAEFVLKIQGLDGLEVAVEKDATEPALDPHKISGMLRHIDAAGIEQIDDSSTAWHKTIVARLWPLCLRLRREPNLVRPPGL